MRTVTGEKSKLNLEKADLDSLKKHHHQVIIKDKDDVPPNSSNDNKEDEDEWGDFVVSN